MADKQIEKLQARINNAFKGEFLSMLRKKGHFLSFCEGTHAHSYALNMCPEQVEGMIGEPVTVPNYCTVYVNLKNGALQISKVA